jgi:hypothetical protein
MNCQCVSYRPSVIDMFETLYWEAKLPPGGRGENYANGRQKYIQMFNPLKPIVVTTCTTCFNILKTLHSAHRMYLCVLYDFRYDSDCFPKQRYPIDLCSGDAVCFL